MNNFYNYVYIITNIGFIVNTILLFITAGVIYSSFSQAIPIRTKTYLILSCVILLILIAFKIIFIAFTDQSEIINDQCSPYYCDHVNFIFSRLILIINIIILGLKWLINSFSILDIFSSPETLICSIVLIISAILCWQYWHLSIPEVCKADSPIGILNGFWSQ